MLLIIFKIEKWNDFLRVTSEKMQQTAFWLEQNLILPMEKMIGSSERVLGSITFSLTSELNFINIIWKFRSFDLF